MNLTPGPHDRSVWHWHPFGDVPEAAGAWVRVQARGGEWQAVREAERGVQQGDVPGKEGRLPPVRQGQLPSRRLAHSARRSGAGCWREVHLQASVYCTELLRSCWRCSGISGRKICLLLLSFITVYI